MKAVRSTLAAKAKYLGMDQDKLEFELRNGTPICSATFWQRHRRLRRLIQPGEILLAAVHRHLPEVKRSPAAALFEPLLMGLEALGLFLLLTAHEGLLLLTFHEGDIRENYDGDQPLAQPIAPRRLAGC